MLAQKMLKPTLCEEIDAKSMRKSSTLTGSLPAIWAISEWKKTLFALHIYI